MKKKTKSARTIRASAASLNPDNPTDVNSLLPPDERVDDVSTIPTGGTVSYDALLQGLADPATRERLEEQMRSASPLPGAPENPRVLAHNAAMNRAATAAFNEPQPGAPHLDPDCGARLAPIARTDSLADLATRMFPTTK